MTNGFGRRAVERTAQVFGHDADKWTEFRRIYRKELDTNGEAVGCCVDWCRKSPVTLLFAAKDRKHNQAVLLRDYLTERLERDHE